MSEELPECPKCGHTGDGFINSDFIFKCLCGFKGRKTLECPVCRGDAVRTKDGYICLGSGCGLAFWEPTEHLGAEAYQVTFEGGWNALAETPDDDLCFLCNEPVLKTETEAQCQNPRCEQFQHKVHTFRLTDAIAEHPNMPEKKDGGKILLGQISDLVSLTQKNLFYETLGGRYRSLHKALWMIQDLKKQVAALEDTGTQFVQKAAIEAKLDDLSRFIKAFSPFHSEEHQKPSIPAHKDK